MKLYDAVTPNTLRVNAFLAEKGVDVPRQRIMVLEGGTRTPEFLAINSRGELPVLELEDGRVLCESVAICRYLEELYPDPPLMGRDAFERAHIEMWNRRMEHLIFQTIGNHVRHTVEFFAEREEQVPAYAAAQLRAFEKNWIWLDTELSDGRPFIAGDQITIADITGMAALMACQFFDIAKPEAATHANRWAASMAERTSYSSSFSRDE
jgi:glutathione S-transferase